jgi:hypothetical protein
MTEIRGHDTPRRCPPSNVTFWRFAIQFERSSRLSYATILISRSCICRVQIMRKQGPKRIFVRIAAGFRAQRLLHERL